MYMYGIMLIFQSHYHSNKFLVILTRGVPFLVLTFHVGSCGAPYPFRILLVGFYPSDARFCPHWNERSFAWSGGPMMSHGSKHKENERGTHAMTSHQNHIKSLPRIYQSKNISRDRTIDQTFSMGNFADRQKMLSTSKHPIFRRSDFCVTPTIHVWYIYLHLP